MSDINLTSDPELLQWSSPISEDPNSIGSGLSSLASEAWEMVKAHPYAFASAAAACLVETGLAPAVAKIATAARLSTEETWGRKIISQLYRDAVVATDDDLKIVASERSNMRHLTFEGPFGTSITDLGMRSISGLKKLKSLDIAWSPISDRGMELAEIDKLPNLQYFNARGTLVGDKTVSWLAHRTNPLEMELVDLRNTALTRNCWTDLLTISSRKLLVNSNDQLLSTASREETLLKFAWQKGVDLDWWGTDKVYSVCVSLDPSGSIVAPIDEILGAAARPPGSAMGKYVTQLWTDIPPMDTKFQG